MANNGINTKFWRDSVWGLASVGVLGISGLTINSIIGRAFGPESLGVFSWCLSVYMLASLVSTFGIQYSVIHRVAEVGPVQQCSEIISSAILAVSPLALIVSASTFLIYPLIPGFNSDFHISNLYISMMWPLVLSMPLFAISKIWVAGLNGMRAMKEMAIVQMVRWVTNLLIVSPICFVVGEAKFLTLGFLGGELVAFLFGLYFLLKLKFRFHLTSAGLRGHFTFGSNCILMSGVDELNTRVDVLMLAWLGSESTVGLYSLASMFSKGSLLVLDVLQINYSPIISSLSRSGSFSELREGLSKIERMAYLLFGPIAAGTIFIYFYYVKYFMGAEFEGSILVFVILQVGAFLYSGANAYGKFFVNTGRPRIQVVISLVALVVNIVLNLVLIRVWGANGAAAATAISLVVAALLLRYKSRLALV